MPESTSDAAPLRSCAQTAHTCLSEEPHKLRCCSGHGAHDHRRASAVPHSTACLRSRSPSFLMLPRWPQVPARRGHASSRGICSVTHGTSPRRCAMWLHGRCALRHWLKPGSPERLPSSAFRPDRLTPPVGLKLSCSREWQRRCCGFCAAFDLRTSTNPRPRAL